MRVPQIAQAMGQITIVADESPPQKRTGEAWAEATFQSMNGDRVHNWRTSCRQTLLFSFDASPAVMESAASIR